MTVLKSLARVWHGLTMLAVLSSPLATLPARPVLAQTTAPTAVSVPGSFQSELGCPGDWQPDCAVTQLTYDAVDDVWQGTWKIPAGSYEFKAALNNSWDVSYGRGGGSENIALTLSAETSVKFYFDFKSKWVTTNRTSLIAVAPGSFQSELGCGGDWQPDCLRSWLQDLDGDGTYTFETTAIPPGSYEFKVALNETWDVSYGQGGGPNNIPFTVAVAGQPVVFSFSSATNTPSVAVRSLDPSPDNNVEWDGLRHDSRDTLYRTPGGAVPSGTPVTVRFRTFHNDVTAVTLRIYDLNANAQVFLPMTPAATDIDCYQADLAGKTCDFWAVTLPNGAPNNFWYRFVVTDGTDTDYYGDNTAALDGGLGAVTDDPVDQSYALMVYDPAFSSPSWASSAVIYQIFPDRFRNGDLRNDPRNGDARYDDPVIRMNWTDLPEGYCRNYADGATNCPWRFDTTPPDWSPTKEGPRGRDYYGGDLRGVTQRLAYLRSLGVTAIYFNPIFAARSNHRYDTADYYQIDPYLGTLDDWRQLEAQAQRLGIRIILDGVYNHMSSDSVQFDRYGRYTTVGACESASSQYRTWFTFRPPAGAEPAACAPSTPGGLDTFYNSWFGFDSIPEINKSLTSVQDFFINGPDSVSRYWLRQGADGWRLDVMGDASFPNGYWESFRGVVRGQDPNAIIIGELWQKDSTLLRYLRGDRADTTMNYRLRDAIIGYLVPGRGFDSKGFGDSGRQISAAEFAARVQAIREDYPDAAYYSLMNLLGSHDTERILWTLTPGDETRAAREQDAANLAAGKARLQVASLIQFTMPGAPTVYYGDEVGVTGDDDPDDRRTYPWVDTGGQPDDALMYHYATLARLRQLFPALNTGDLRMLLAGENVDLLAYGRRSGDQAVVVTLNRGTSEQTVTVPVAGYLPNGTALVRVYGVGASNPGRNPGAVAPLRRVVVANGTLTVRVPAMGAIVWVTTGADLTPTAAPTGLAVTASASQQVALSWSAVTGAGGYNVYRSPLTGGGFVRVNSAPVTGTSFTDTGLRNGREYFYVVRALDRAGNESVASNEVSGLPALTIGWANLQWPPTINHTLSVTTRTPDIYGQVWIDGATNAPGATPTLQAQLGYGPVGSDPATWTTWSEAAFNADVGNNDEFKASLLPETAGTYDYVYRYSTNGGRSWLYADLNGPVASGSRPANPGKLTVSASADATPPATPANLRVDSASPAGISLSWSAVTGDASLYGYEVLRSATTGGPYTLLARVTAATYTDLAISQGATYYYVVRALDNGFNRSPNSTEVRATAELRTVTMVFNVTVPATTDATGRGVYIAGFLDRLDGGLPQWNPGGVVLTRISATQWTITLTGKEGTQIEYKYTLGAWDYVEKDGTCGEVANRQLTLSYGASGTQAVSDTVGNWRNVPPCGN